MKLRELIEALQSPDCLTKTYSTDEARIKDLMKKRVEFYDGSNAKGMTLLSVYMSVDGKAIYVDIGQENHHE